MQPSVASLLASYSVKPTFVPDSLCHNLDWSPIAVAPSQSPIAALLSGFVFAGIVVILSVKAPFKGESAQALKLLFTAFFGLAVTAYLLADTSGEQTCLRAETTEALAGGSLGTFAVITIVALTWLVVAYNHHDHGVLKFVNALVYVSCLFVALEITVSALTYINVDLYYRNNRIADIVILGVGVLAILLDVTWMLWWHIKKPAKNIANTLHMTTTTVGAVDRCAWAALSYLAISSLATGIEAGLPPHMWIRPTSWAIYLATAGSLGLPLIVLAFALGALARTA